MSIITLWKVDIFSTGKGLKGAIPLTQIWKFGYVFVFT